MIKKKHPTLKIVTLILLDSNSTEGLPASLLNDSAITLQGLTSAQEMSSEVSARFSLLSLQ